jgi:hypothetical protein
MKLLFVHFWHLWFWRKRFLKIKLFLAVFHFLFRNYSEFRNHMNFKEDHPRFIPAKNSLGVVVSEKMMSKEKLTRMHMRGHDIRSE